MPVAKGRHLLLSTSIRGCCFSEPRITAWGDRCGGEFVAKYMGDGVLAYFGYPRADEHDAERAVRAALKLVEKVAGLDTARRRRCSCGSASPRASPA
jgi:class 3 adenylate cyclase